jgi:hypothetical protein
MLSSPQYSGTKIGAVIYGLAAGIAILLGIVFASVLLGVLIAIVANARGWTGLGEYQPWLPVGFGEYSIVPGTMMGAIVCWKIWKSKLG